MDENKTGLMASNEASSPLLNQFREALSPAASKPMTFEQRLAGLSDAERTFILRTAKMVQLAMQMRKASNDRTMGWADLVKSMYGNLGITKRSLIAELLEEVDPLDFVPQPKAQLSSQEMARSLYDRPEYQLPELSKADDDTATTLQAVLADTAQEPRTKQSQVAVGKEAFLAAYTPVAKEVAEDLGVSYKIVLAQAALESGWGKSVQGNGLMGIKSHGEEGGVDVVTHEVVNGKKVKITDSFRQYDTPEDSIRGYAGFLKANSRYRHFLRAGVENEDAQLSALQSSGYATDPLYSQKLKNIIKGIPDEEGQG
jgi:flagellum-specific peptidoglycan hydrolase FlgJ